MALGTFLICIGKRFWSIIISFISCVFSKLRKPKRLQERNKAYAAKIALQLEAYIDGCVNIANTEIRDEPIYNIVDVFSPKEIYSEHYLNYMYYDYTLVSRLHTLEGKKNNAHDSIFNFLNTVSNSHENTYFFKKKQLEFVQLGLEACSILKSWKEFYELPHVERGDEEPEIILQRKIEDSERREDC